MGKFSIKYKIPRNKIYNTEPLLKEKYLLKVKNVEFIAKASCDVTLSDNLKILKIRRKTSFSAFRNSSVLKIKAKDFV